MPVRWKQEHIRVSVEKVSPSADISAATVRALP
jgi:hypothetical protein